MSGKLFQILTTREQNSIYLHYSDKYVTYDLRLTALWLQLEELQLTNLTCGDV